MRAFVASLIFACSFILGAVPLTLAYSGQLQAHSSQELLKKKAGQLIWVGYHNLEQIKEIQPSGIVFFGWNIKTAQDLQNAVRGIRKQEKVLGLERALTALDHEGGRVMRLKSGLSAVPDAAALGATRDSELVSEVSFMMARELKNIGVDINFAPVMDRGDARSFLENRVWGDNSQDVTQMTSAFLEGHIRGGTFPFPKHFPGHGPLAFQDVHFIKGINYQSKEKMMSEDLPPFLHAMHDPRIPGLMTANVELEAFGRQTASLSKRVLSDFLRKELGYEGFILSDDLEMGGVSSQSIDVADTALKSLTSGVDSVLLVWDQEAQKRVRDRIVQAMQSGELSEADVDRKIARIQNIKEKVLKIKYESQKFPSISFAQKRELINRAWLNSQSWVLGTESELVKNLNPNSKSPWLVLLPQGAYAREWKRFRAQDKILRFDVTRGENTQLLKFMEKASKNSQPLVVVTPPLHKDGGEWVRALSRFFNKSYKDPSCKAPVLWVHMGVLPVRSPRIEKPQKPFSLVHLNSASSISLRHFLGVLSSRANSWNSVSQRYSLSSQSP
ncbi:MAG: glycoside hydrolase family 3 N-terminal domain-containing protein [Bdellovibrionota bacterium]